MIRFVPGLRESAGPPQPGSGWFVYGAGPEAWLEEISSWGVSLDGATLRIAPVSSSDPRPCGALVTPKAGDRWAVTSPRAVPCRCVGGKLWVPCALRLDPPLSDPELAALPGDPALLIPGPGLVAFTPGDALAPAALLAPPTERASSWDRAVPGRAVPPRLSSVEPDDPPRLDVVLRGAGTDIGTGRTGDLPGAPGEMSLLEQALKRAGMGVLGTLQWLSSVGTSPARPPDSAGGPGWLDRIRHWSAETLARFAADLQRAREKEVTRLLSLLDRDPDLGLRFALPIGGAGTRGVAPPSGTLGPRTVDFSISRLGGGAASDAWDLGQEARQQLTRRYRELALRELHLGRHRRAAYIFAELLGDYREAASALAEGRHYREAAVLLREKLNLPLQAAACLERGGLLVEAAEIYESLEKWETVGDLMHRVERADDADRAWRKAVERLVDKGDSLAAGKLLGGKLRAPDEALALWAAAWPWSHQAGACVDARLALLGSLGRHQDARALLDALVAECAQAVASRGVLVARSCAIAAGSYPDRKVRDRAADAARVVAGTRLPEADADDAREFLAAVRRASPDDRLLARDLKRWEARRPRPVASPAPRPTQGGWAPVVAAVLQLPADIMWETAAGRRDLLHVAGFGRGGAVLARLPWTDAAQMLTWSPGINYPHILAPGPENSRLVLFAGSPGPRLDLLSFPASDAVPSETPAGTPPWFPDEVLGAATAESGSLWVVREHLGHLVAWSYTSGGSISSIHPLADLEAALPEGESLRGVAPIPTVAFRNSLYVALGARLARVGHEGATRHHDLRGPITEVVASSHASAPSIACALDAGGAVFFDPDELTDVRLFGDDLADPLLAFTRDGALVAVSEREGRIYELKDRRVVEKASFPVRGRPVAVVPGRNPGELAIVAGNGEVRLLAIPRK